MFDGLFVLLLRHQQIYLYYCLLYTSDAADEEDSVDLGGRRIIKKKKTNKYDNEIKTRTRITNA